MQHFLLFLSPSPPLPTYTSRSPDLLVLIDENSDPVLLGGLVQGEEAL